MKREIPAQGQNGVGRAHLKVFRDEGRAFIPWWFRAFPDNGDAIAFLDVKLEANRIKRRSEKSQLLGKHL